MCEILSDSWMNIRVSQVVPSVFRYILRMFPCYIGILDVILVCPNLIFVKQNLKSANFYNKRLKKDFNV